MDRQQNRFCRRVGVGFGLSCLIGLAAICESKPPADESQTRFAERLVYDPQTSTWVREEPPEPGTPDGDLSLIRAELARSEYKDAAKHLDDWVKKYGPDSPRLPEAEFLRGQAAFLNHRLMRAHQVYQDVLNNWPGSEWAEKSMRGELIIAEAFLSGKKRRVLGMPLVQAHDEGIEILDEIIINQPHHPLAEQAARVKADYYFRTGEFELAEDSYAQLARNYPGGPNAREAMLQSAYAALASFPGVQFDDAALIEAEERFLQFKRAFPLYAQDDEINQLLENIHAKRAEKEFQIGRYYERARKRGAAIFYYELIQSDYPQTNWATLARSRLASLSVGPEPEQYEQYEVIEAGETRPAAALENNE